MRRLHFLDRRLSTDTGEMRDARPVNVRVQQADLRPALMEPERQTGCNRTLADTSLSAADCDQILDP